MFIFEGKQAKAEFREQHEIDSVVSSLEGKGYKPILRSMLKTASSVISAQEGSLPTALLKERGIGRGVVGDLLFTESSAYVLQPVRTRIYVWELRHHRVDSEISTFCGDIESSVKTRIDGRRVRGMDFTWHSIKKTVGLRSSIQRRHPFSDTIKLETKEATYTEDE
jgi:hypothetical protein